MAGSLCFSDLVATGCLRELTGVDVVPDLVFEQSTGHEGLWRGRCSYARHAVEVRKLLDGRRVVLIDKVIRGQAPSPGLSFILKPHRIPATSVRHGGCSSHRDAISHLFPSSPKTHTGRCPLPKPTVCGHRSP